MVVAQPAHNGEESLALPETISRDFSSIQAIYHATVADQIGLSLTDYKCLDLILRAQQRLSAGSLARNSGLTTGAVTGVVDRLERAGYVGRVRDDQDRRRVLIEPVAGAADRIAWVFQPMRAALEEMERDFDEKELATVRRYMHRATRVFRQQTAALPAYVATRRNGSR